MTLEEARALVKTVKIGGYDQDDHWRTREALALFLVQTYELGWAHGRLAREAAEREERKANG